MSKTKQNLSPAIRFPQFSKPWQSSKLVNLAVGGFTNGVFNDPERVGSGYRLVNVKDMYVGDRVIIENLTLLEISEKEFQKNQVRFGDIFFTRSSLVKEGIAWSNVMLDDVNDVTYDGHLIKMSLDINTIDPYFFSKVLRTSTLRRQIVARGKTGTMTTIGQNDMASVVAYYPEMKEQRKIAAFLGAVDAKLDALRRKRELLTEYKRGVMQKLFSQEIRFTQDDGSPFPEWVTKKLGEIASFKKGKGISKDDIVQNGMNPCIRYGELYTDYDEVITHIKSFTNMDLKGMILSNTNDVIIPSSGEDRFDMAQAACVQVSNVILGGDLNIIRGNFNGIFLAYYLNTAKRHDIARVAQGNSVVHLYSSQLAALTIKTPCIDEQQKIATFLTTIDNKITAVDQQIEQVETFKKGLLQQMFV